MEHKDDLSFDLEDIMREFGNAPVAILDPEPIPEPEPEPEPEPVIEPEPEPEIAEPEDALSGDTIRLDKIQQAVSAAEATDLSKTAEFSPIPAEPEELEEEYLPSPTTEPDVEPFSDEWEPEYDEPMGVYPTPEPIPFRRKSRARELREKLVSGPERIYYSLTELGLGKLQLSMILCFAIFLFSAGVSLMYSWGMIGPDRMKFLVFAEFMGLLGAGLLGCYRLMDGMADLFHLNFTMNSLLVITFAVCCVDGVLCLQSPRLPVGAAFSLEMTMAIWSTYHRRNTLMGQMDTLRRASTLDSIALVPDFYNSQPGFRVGRGEVEHFMDRFEAPLGPERVLNWYALTAMVLSIGVGILGAVRHGFAEGVQLCAASMLVSVPATAFLTITRPVAILEKRLHSLGVVLCGWQGIQAACGQALYPLEDTDLFPMGAAKLGGVKFIGNRGPDEIVSYATALIRANGGALVTPFSNLMVSRGGWQCHAENLRHHTGGISGTIEDEQVLVGNQACLQEMGIAIPENTRIENAVYCAIAGELCAVFAVAYGRAKSTVAGLQTLSDCKGLSPVILSEDMIITENLLQSRFRIRTRNMLFPQREERLELSKIEPDEADTVVALTIREGLAPKAFAITGARMLRTALRSGVVVHMLGGILGLLMMTALAWVGCSDSVLSPANILLYQMLWMVPGLLITEWTRTL